MKKNRNRIKKTRNTLITAKHTLIIVIVGTALASAVAFLITRGIGLLWGSHAFSN